VCHTGHNLNIGDLKSPLHSDAVPPARPHLLIVPLPYGPSIHTRESMGAILFFFFKIYLFYVCEYTVTVFRHTRRGHQIPLQMVVSHHVVAGN
jgi:hypothetical protein